MDSNPSHLDNWISNGNTDIKKQLKNDTYSLPVKKAIHYHKNEEQHKYGEYKKGRICRLKAKKIITDSYTMNRFNINSV